MNKDSEEGILKNHLKILILELNYYTNDVWNDSLNLL